MPVLELAEQAGLSRLIGKHVDLPSTPVKSGAVNPVGKLTSIIGGMMCGADGIEDVNGLRAGGTPRVFDDVYAPSTLGIFLREFTFGHANQLAAVARQHLVALAARTPLLPDIEQRTFVDIDSLLRPVYGHHKQGASFGHAKIASRALLRLGLSPQITTISTRQAAPVIAEARLRSGKAASGRAAAAQVKQAIATARACRAANILVRGDSAFGTKKVMSTCVAEGTQFSLSVSRNKRINAAIEVIDEATASTTRAISDNALTAPFRRRTATLEALRVDRQLDEALTHGPDPLHLAVVFGLDQTQQSDTAHLV